MTVWVVRKSLDGGLVGAPRLCAKPGRMARVPGLMTIEEQIAVMLGDSESVEGAGALGRWNVLEGGELKGFIEVLDGAAGS